MTPRTKNSRTRWAVVVVPVVAAAIGMAAGGRTAGAAADGDVEAFRERCATRISIALVGKGASEALLASSDPSSSVDALLESGDFVERFARFVNAEFNRDPGKDSAEDASYHLAKYVVKNGKPWSDVFLGPYKVDATGENGAVQVTEDANGLGYFRSQPWLLRYAGNELAGLKIATAYRILNNVVGLQLMATTNAPDADVSAKGREAGSCAGCHYQNWYALDHVAGVLSTKVTNDKGEVSFKPYSGSAKSLLGGKSIANDKELVQALVESENFSFQACRLSFKYLYGRSENRCEGPVLDRCIDAFKATKTIQSAMAVIAKGPGFCQ
ncbi:hypothetical protein LZC95_44060 [Pendulispora brunnea]|uniref:Uncharacterized protein n=1 Tax=Pendulispora brunnea TaxID=2905690 RepID=A0ABZ2K404_9BACT